jgi:hypothetical protein
MRHETFGDGTQIIILEVAVGAKLKNNDHLLIMKGYWATWWQNPINRLRIR